MRTPEQRLNTRVNVTFPCLCEETELSDATVLDLSFGGVLLQCTDLLPVGTTVVLTPVSPSRELLAPLTAEVVRVHGDIEPGRTVHVGARFVELGAEERRCLLWLMNNSPRTESKEPVYFRSDEGPNVSHYRLRMQIWLPGRKRTSARLAA